MALDPNKAQRTKLHHPSNFSTNSGMESHYFFSPQEHSEKKGFYEKDFGISNASFESIDYADLSDRRVLIERNRKFSGSRERKSPNAVCHFGSFSCEDRSKHHSNFQGIECQCDLGSFSRSNSNSNRSNVRTLQGAERCFKPYRFASDGNFGSVKKPNSEMGVRPPCRVASEGNLNELEYEFDFGSVLERRSISPKVRTSLTPEIVSDLRKTKDLGNEVTQTHRSPTYGLYFSPNDDSRLIKSKTSDKPRMNHLSPRPQCLCYKPKSQVRDSYSSHNLQEITGESLPNKPEKKVQFGSTKSNSSLSRMCKFAIFWVFLVIILLSLPIKEISFLRPKFVARNSSLVINQTDLFLKPVDLGSNHSEEVNLDGEIEPFIEEESSSSGELEKKIESLASNGTAPIEEEDEKLEESDFIEIPVEENNGHEEFQSEIEDEFKSENAKQCEMLDFTVDELEEAPVPVPGEKIGYVALVQADTNRVEDRKVKLRVRFCVAFISVAVCASLVSCIIRREQFGQMLERYTSSKNGEKGSKKPPMRDSAVLLDGSYGSILTYEKIPAKKGVRDNDGLLTPVRRSSRIRRNIASPS